MVDESKREPGEERSEEQAEAEAESHWEGEENIPGASERHAHQPSDVDAMGRDKRRQVVGGQYGATLRKQITVYGAFVAIVAISVIAFLTIVTNIDQRERPLEETAPWTEAAADQTPPRPIDFPRNGPTDTIPIEEIGDAVPPNQSDQDTETESSP
jgi:hypothetical protein